MPDGDIPQGWEGERTFVVFRRGDLGCLVLPTEDDDSVDELIQALPSGTQVVSTIRGVSNRATQCLQNNYRAFAVQGKRSMLLQLFTREQN